MKNPSAVAYLAQFDIKATQHWRKANSIFLTTEDDKNVATKLSAKFGVTTHRRTWGGTYYTFNVPGLGAIVATKYDGFHGKTFGITIYNGEAI